MLVMDSGLGGVSVVRALRQLAPQQKLHYLADTAGFPYGARAPADIAARAVTLLRALEVERHYRAVVLACNTLSTLCLEQLRAEFLCPFVGTVPAVKVAASQARRFTLLATPNTVDSDYSKNLIAQFAAGCVVDRVAAPNLAMMAERALLGDMPEDAALAREIAPAFRNDVAGKTEAVVLGCTHYPLLLPTLRRLAPWEITWIDSSDAIARRALSFDAADAALTDTAIITDTGTREAYMLAFGREGFGQLQVLEHPAGIDDAA